jgi:hypothetical protein
VSDWLLDGESHIVGVGRVPHCEEGVGPAHLLQATPRDLKQAILLVGYQDSCPTGSETHSPIGWISGQLPQVI